MGPWIPMFPLFGHIVNLQLVGFESSIEKCFPFALLHPWEAKKAVTEDLKKDENYAGWVSCFSEKLWEEYQGKHGVSSSNHGPNTVFQLSMADLDPLEVRQEDPRPQITNSFSFLHFC